MITLVSKKTRPMGLDIGQNSIKMIQLGAVADNISVVAAAETVFDPQDCCGGHDKKEFTASAVKEMLARENFAGKEVISALPNELVKIKSLRIDSAEAAKMTELVYKEAVERVGIDVNTHEIRYTDAGIVHQGEETKKEVILFAAKKEDISEHIEMLETVGLKPEAIDLVPCALLRCFLRSLRRQEDKNQVSVFIDIGSTFTTVTVSAGQNITFIKKIPIAGMAFNTRVAEKLSVSNNQAALLRAKMRNSSSSDTVDASTAQDIKAAMGSSIDELAREISVCFRYYAVTFRGQKPEEAVLTGGEAQEPQLLDALNNQLDVNIKTAQPFRGIDTSRLYFRVDNEHIHPEWSVPVGIAMKGWEINDYSTDSTAVDNERN